MGASAVETDDAETRSDPICSSATVQNLGKVNRSPWSPWHLQARDFQPHTLVYSCLLLSTKSSITLWYTTFALPNQL